MKQDLKITVNPFTREIVISDSLQSIDHTFKELDEWQSFEFHDAVVDVHFYYETKLEMCVYPVIDNETTTTGSIPYKLKIVLTEEELQAEIF